MNEDFIWGFPRAVVPANNEKPLEVGFEIDLKEIEEVISKELSQASLAG